MKKIDLLSVSFVLLVLIVAYLSLQPKDGPIKIEVNDKIGHFMAYFALMMNGELIFQNKYYTAAGVLLFSLLLETLQNYIPGRVFSHLDLLANGSGALFGILFLSIFGSKIQEVFRKLKISTH
jgi:VanZ family protein